MELDITATQELAAAVVLQAIRDWRGLCRGRRPSKYHNFEELEHFFRHDCVDYVSNPDIAGQIWQLMQRERAASKKKRRWTDGRLEEGGR